MTETTLTTMNLTKESTAIKIAQSFVSAGTTRIDYTLPTDLGVISGLIICVSDKPFNNAMAPSTGQRYTAGTDLVTFTGDRIYNTYVVFSANLVAGELLPLTGSVQVSNMDPTSNWYIYGFGVSNTYDYSSIPSFSYLVASEPNNDVPSTFAGAIPQNIQAPTSPTVGQVFYNLNTGKVQLWTGATWINASDKAVPVGPSNAYPTSPVTGDFFYNLTVKQLFVFDGVNWNRADTDQQGIPMYDKIGVGTDGSLDERAKLVEVLKIQMGYPKVCVELTEASFDVAIGNALDEIRRRADNAYYDAHIIMELIPGQQRYYLNDPRNGSNRVVNVLKIHRLNIMGMNSITGEASPYAQMYLQQLYSSGSFDILSIHLMASLAEDYNMIFAGDLSYNWIENTRELHIFKNINKEEKVVLECSLERTEQDLLTDRWMKQWIQHWAHAECLEQLGTIRSKYGNLPGAGGGITLNGSELLAQAETMFQEALRQIQDFEVGNGGHTYSGAAFLIG